MRQRIQLNADLGEGCNNDQAILPFIDAANIACGGHAGDAESIKSIIIAAKSFGVKIGAHPSFPDKAGFGRAAMQLNAQQLKDTIHQQLHLINDIANAQDYPLNHIKPHGALYNQAASDRALANQLAEIFADFNSELTIIGLAGGELIRSARASGLNVMAEGFIDRRYLANGQLAPRDREGAVINTIDQACQQAINIIKSKPITTLDGGEVHLQLDTLCLHGDGDQAAELASSIASLLK